MAKAIQWIADFSKKHRIFCSAMVAIFCTIPNWIYSVFRLFSSEPFVPWLLSGGVKVPEIDIAHIIPVILGVVLIVVIYPKNKDLPQVLSNTADDGTGTDPVPANSNQLPLSTEQAILVIIVTVLVLSPFLHFSEHI